MPLLVLLFVLTQIVEIWILIEVGHAIGGWQTLALLVVDSVLGAALLRREGRRTWRAFRRALHEQRAPALEVADGALVLVGGTLLLTPGFLSDIVGVLCLLPPTRAALRPMLTRAVARRLGIGGLGIGGLGIGGLGGRAARDRAPARGSDVIEGEVVNDEGPPPQRRRP